MTTPGDTEVSSAKSPCSPPTASDSVEEIERIIGVGKRCPGRRHAAPHVSKGPYSRHKTVGPRSVPLEGDVDLATVASSTPGMVGAGLRNLVNDAALLAAHRGRKTVSRDELADALEKIVLGAARRGAAHPDLRRRA